LILLSKRKNLNQKDMEETGLTELQREFMKTKRKPKARLVKTQGRIADPVTVSGPKLGRIATSGMVEKFQINLTRPGV